VTVDVHCDCGHRFEARDDQVGGIVNCPGCGKATDVPGLRDSAWRSLQVGAVLLWTGVTVAATASQGPVAGAVWAIVLGGLLWLLSRAL
jgi:hypothetical protein